MRSKGLARWGLMAALVGMGSAGAVAAPGRTESAPAKAPAPAPAEAETEEVEITDDKIVEVLVEAGGILQQAAAVGSEKRPAGPVATEAKALEKELGSMVKRLEAHARQRGYPVTATDPNVASPERERFNEFLANLSSLDTGEFNPTYLTVVREFLGEMLSLVAGAQELTSDPALRTMLIDMEWSLDEHRAKVEQLLMSQPAAPSPTPTRGP